MAGVMTVRAAVAIPAARYSGAWHSAWLLFMAGCWVAAGRAEPLPGSDAEDGVSTSVGTGREFWWVCAVLAEPLSYALWYATAPSNRVVPIARPYAIEK